MTVVSDTRPQMGDELLPCPFCGAPADPPELYGESKTAMFVDCSKCGANVYHSSVDKDANCVAVVTAWNRRASLPQPTAGSTGEGEAKRLSFVIERDRARCAEILTAVRRAIRGHEWLRLGRGSYEYDDERWKEEFGAAIDGIEEALKPLAAMARDWTDCPTKREEILAARASTPAQSGVVDAAKKIVKFYQHRMKTPGYSKSDKVRLIVVGCIPESDADFTNGDLRKLSEAIADAERAPSQPAPVVDEAELRGALILHFTGYLSRMKAGEGECGPIDLAAVALKAIRECREDADALRASPQPDRESERVSMPRKVSHQMAVAINAALNAAEPEKFVGRSPEEALQPIWDAAVKAVEVQS